MQKDARDEPPRLAFGDERRDEGPVPQYLARLCYQSYVPRDGPGGRAEVRDAEVDENAGGYEAVGYRQALVILPDQGRLTSRAASPT